MRVLLVEPYFGGSHRAWAEGLQRFSRHDVTLLTHDARFWKWRMQGAHVTLARSAQQALDAGALFDVILASSMLNLSSFRGALRSDRRMTTVLYMHENQLSYPLSPRDREDETYPMINWASMCAADRVVFNSRFHLDEWFSKIGPLLNRFPDYKHTELVEEVRSKSSVLGVGVDLARLDAPGAADLGDAPVILWNHRWEHDKGPEILVAALKDLAATGREFSVVLTGEQFVNEPQEFDELQSVLGERLAHAGYVSDADYATLIGAAEVVVSTARQEFFGVSITEAVYAGAMPLLPARLVYPERIPSELHDACLYRNASELAVRLAWAIDNRGEAAEIARLLRPVMAEHDWSQMAPRYDALLEDAASG